MAAEIQVGTAVLHGITNSGTAISITGYATLLFDKVSAQHKFKLAEYQDSVDFDVNLTATNEHQEVEIDFEPSGATRAAAAAVAAFLTPLSKVTLANFKVSMLNGDYVYIGDTKLDLTNVGAAKMSGLKLRKYADSTQNTSLTTTVSG